MADIKRIVTSDVPGRNLSDTYERSYVVGEDGRIDYYTGGGEMLAVVKPGTIYGADHDSADGQGLNTLKLIPHAPEGFANDDRYLVIDPTMPNHIHIRAGGTIDQSNAELILGGEANHVRVNDGSRTVTISSKQPQTIQAVLNINFESNEYMVFNDMVPVSNNGWYTEVNGTRYYVADVTYPTEGQTQVYVPGATFQSQGVYNMFSPEVSSQWQFDGEGIVYGPGDGAATTFTKIETINNGTGQNVKIGDDAWIGDLNVANHIAITGLQDPTQAGIVLGNPITGTISVAEDDLAITSNGTMTIEAVGGDMNFYMDGGMYIGDSNSGNQIIKRSDLESFVSPTMVRYSPEFAANGLTFTGSGTTYPTYNSYYTKAGKMVSFVIEVDLSTVTNFGTGQYRLQLPFLPAFGYNHFTGWVNVDPAVNPDVANGHIILNADHAGMTDVLDLHYLKQGGGAHTPIIEGLFLQGTPVTLTTSSKIYVNGTYICQ